ncbi:XRE family transcriptional regulator [Escherichia coli]
MPIRDRIERNTQQRTWHAWENAEQVDVTVWRTTQALSVRDLLPHMQGMRKADIIRRLENELGETAGNV